VKDIESLDIISQQIKISLTAVHTTKGRMENKFGEYVTKISNWLESMGDIYDGMEVEMDDIIKKLTALKINERISEVSAKMKKVIGQLERMTTTSGLYSKNSGEIKKFLKQISKVHQSIVSYRENLGED
jgi:methyl-accepting chemotaxis protein